MNLLARIFLVVLLLAGAAAPAAGQTVTELGSGFNAPRGVAVDGSGNVFVGDTGNDLVKEILATDGSIRTFSNFFPDALGGNLPFVSPEGLAIEANGDVLVADPGFTQQLLWEINPSSGAVGAEDIDATPSVVAVDNAGDLLVNYTTFPLVRELSQGYIISNAWLGEDSVLWSNAIISGVVADASGNVYLTSESETQILKVNVASQAMTLLGSGLNAPEATAIDAAGNIYVADTGSNSVKLVFAADGAVATIATGLSRPSAVAVDGSGNVYVADTGNNAVKKIQPVTAVAGVLPAAGPLAGQNTVTIEGTALTGATAVSFGGAPAASFAVNSSTSITAVAPAGSAGTVDVVVTTPSGTSAVVAGDVYIYEGPPSITAISPAAGPLAGGTMVTITGTNLIAASQVLFGATAATQVVVNSATSITATAPAGTGTVDVTVTTPSGTSPTNSGDEFTYVPRPTVTGLSPSAGPLAGGTLVTITGTNLSGAGAVSFGSTSTLIFEVDSDTSITATAPSGAAGKVNVTVTTPGGTSATGVADGYTYVAAPIVTAITPSTGPLAAGTAVTITGTSLTAASAVKFGTTAATNVTVVSATSITATAPAGSAGVVDVTVTTPGGISATSAADRYTYVAAPTVTAISPSSGPLAAGTRVTITGTNLTAASAVKFGAAPATAVTVVSATEITATAPAGAAGAVDVTVTTPGGTSAAGGADQYLYRPVPSLTGLGPSSGPAIGGTLVVITGTGLTGAASVAFGALPAASFHVDSDTQVTAISPASSTAGGVDVTVATTGGTSATGAADRFTFIGQTNVTVTASANPSQYGQVVTFTATVAGTGGKPTGTIVFKDGAATLFTGTLAGQISSFTTSALSTGSHAISVAYSGDGSFAGSSAGLVQMVQETAATPGQAYIYQSTLGTPGVAKPDASHFNAPSASAVDPVNGHLLIADTGNQRVQVLDTGTLALVATLGTPGAAGSDNAHFDDPAGVNFDAGSDRIFVADSGNDRIQVFDAKSFAYVATLGPSSAGDARMAAAAGTGFSTPVGVQVNAATGQLYVADTGNQRVQIFDAATLAYVGTLGSTGVAGSDAAHFNAPKDAAVNPTANEILVADSGNGRVQRFDAATLAYKGTIGGAGLSVSSNDDLGTPVSVSYDSVSNLILVGDDGAAQRVQVFDALSYSYVLTLGTTGSAGSSNTQFSGPSGIAIDAAHGRVFIGDRQNDRVQVFSVAPTVAFASVLPGSRSVQLGRPATIFASLVNAGTVPLEGCRVALPVTAPTGLSLSYQTTNPATNALTGTADTPATIAANNGVQSFLVTLLGTEDFSAPGMALDFDCLGVGPAAIDSGVDTVDLAMSTTPAADIIALAATQSGNGIAELPAGGVGAFAVASSNVGATAQIIVSVDTGTASLPLTATLCQSNPSTGACLATPASSLTLNDAAGSAPTFSVFLQAKATIPFAPAMNRVFVRFKDAAGGLHGSTSVAVQAQ
ncbi:MAG: IPT/TIG domain-containing protein [Aliidongia sp.]